MSSKTQLVWNPLKDYLLPKLQACKGVQIIIAPFIQQATLASLVDACVDVSQLRVITRWNPKDIAAGVSDLEVYSFLKSKNIKLYLHKTIHLKLFVLDANKAFSASGNVTGRGLGVSGNHSNIEVGCEVPLSLHDWLHIHQILEKSILVDDEIYGQAKKFLQSLPTSDMDLPELNFTSQNDKAFSWLSLPASENPVVLFDFYESLHAGATPEQDVAGFMHDLAIYHIPLGLNRSQFFDLLRSQFIENPFIKAIVELLKHNKTARFGLVNEWLQLNCSDKPTPYRWELKATTRCLYDWLIYFFPEITWDTPNHSMILRWNQIAK